MRLRSLRSVALRDIEAAARNGNPARVLASTRKLELIEDVMRRYDEITRDVESLVAANGSPLYPQATSEPGAARMKTTLHGTRLSARQRGEMRKREFVERHSRLGLRQVKGAIHRSAGGTLVGIAYAREAVKDKWLLGLPERAYEHAILLCESVSGRITSVSLPKDFLAR